MEKPEPERHLEVLEIRLENEPVSGAQAKRTGAIIRFVFGPHEKFHIGTFLVHKAPTVTELDVRRSITDAVMHWRRQEKMKLVRRMMTGTLN